MHACMTVEGVLSLIHKIWGIIPTKGFILFDSTRCIGCRSCEEACEEENASRKRKWSKDVHGDFRKPPEGLSGDKWIHLSYHKLPLQNGKNTNPNNPPKALGSNKRPHQNKLVKSNQKSLEELLAEMAETIVKLQGLLAKIYRKKRR